MNPTTANPTPEEEEPFVHEECGDSMWDAVLAQPDPAPALPAPTSKPAAPEPPASTK